MPLRPPFATIDDIEARHPRELLVIAADEVTRQVDVERVDAALIDVSTEIRGILAARYTPQQLDTLDDDSLGMLRMYAIDMAMYRIPLSFARSAVQFKERYDAAVKRLEAIAGGKGGLVSASDSSGSAGGSGGSGGSGPGASSIAPNEVLIDVPERMFTRDRFRGAR